MVVLPLFLFTHATQATVSRLRNMSGFEVYTLGVYFFS
jgi:hypothetical protein